MPLGDLQQHVAVAQVIGRPRQLPGRGGRHAGHVFQRGPHHHVCTVLGNQDIAVAQGLAAFDRHAELAAALVQVQALAAAAAFGQGQRHAGRLAQVQAAGGAAFDESVGDFHDQNRK
ncbi:Uncharacterised protein [Bordetella pertussis]|nr:Uncharacterised protein [Bordetella pertussis]